MSVKVSILLGVLSAAATTILLVIISSRPRNDDIVLEIAKACVQGITLVLIGSVVTMATFLFQQARLDRTAEAARILEQQREDWRREISNQIDERRRRDDLLRSILDQTIESYGVVKKIRRLLDAQTRGIDRRSIALDVYDRHMNELNEQQLLFETLRRTSPLARTEKLASSARQSRGPSTALENNFASIENYLKKVVDEYQKSRVLVVQNGGELSVDHLPELADFVSRLGAFSDGSTVYVRKVTKELQEELLAPLNLPTVGNIQ